MHIKYGNNLLLGGCVVLLLVLCWLSVSSPIRFDRERKHREQAVIACLLKIRAAEDAYHTRHGIYAPSIDSLVAEKLISKETAIIPYSNGQKFVINTAIVTGADGSAIRLIECGASYAQYLYNMDKGQIEQLTRQANESGQYAGLKIGDLTTPDNNAGNWE